MHIFSNMLVLTYIKPNIFIYKYIKRNITKKKLIKDGSHHKLRQESLTDKFYHG